MLGYGHVLLKSLIGLTPRDVHGRMAPNGWGGTQELSPWKENLGILAPMEVAQQRATYLVKKFPLGHGTLFASNEGS